MEHGADTCEAMGVTPVEHGADTLNGIQAIPSLGYSESQAFGKAGSMQMNGQGVGTALLNSARVEAGPAECMEPPGEGSRAK